MKLCLSDDKQTKNKLVRLTEQQFCLMKTREPVLLLLAFFFFFSSMQTIDMHTNCNPIPSLTHYQCYQLKNSLTSKGRVQTDFWEQHFCKQTGIHRDMDLQKAPPSPQQAGLPLVQGEARAPSNAPRRDPGPPWDGQASQSLGRNHEGRLWGTWS